MPIIKYIGIIFKIVFIRLNRIIFEMGVNASKISDEYKKEIVKLTSNNHNNIKTDQFTSEKVKPNERDTKESKMQEKSESIKNKTSGKISEFVEGTKNEYKVKRSSNGLHQ
jgi:hypothetical protein